MPTKIVILVFLNDIAYRVIKLRIHTDSNFYHITACRASTNEYTNKIKNVKTYRANKINIC